MWNRLLPRSLSTRMVLLTLVTILLVQAVTFASISYYRKQFTENVTVDFVATTIRTLRSALAQIPSEQRAEFVRRASENAWHLWSHSLPADARMENRRRHARDAGRAQDAQASQGSSLRANLRSFVDALNTRLDEDARVALSRGSSPKLFISLITPAPETETLKNREWLVIPLDRIAMTPQTPIVFFWIAGMTLFLVLAALFAWHITRPLTRLAKAADELAAGNPQRVTPSGPTETRILGERFNAMLDTLAESNAVQRTLLAGLPHDLKAPLARMWLRVEMMQDQAMKEGMLKDVQDMQRMVDQFIVFVRGTDPASYQFQPLVLNAWLEEQVAAWESAGSPVHLVSTPPAPLWIRADTLALGRLLDNLVTNALNHAKPPVEISLAAEQNLAVITVRDHGPGIDPERRAEALRPFSRLDSARTRTGSVGLGLALADAIVRIHHGTLTLNDAPQGGLLIRITLPQTSPGATATA